MRYLIVQDWQNTKGNHAGMVHMCRLLCENYPTEYKMIVKDCPPPMKVRNNALIKKLMLRYDLEVYRRQYVRDYMRICQSMFSLLKAGDSVYLLEYNEPQPTQYELACFIKKNHPDVKIYAMSHLTPLFFRQEKNVQKRVLKWDKPIDKHLTLGSSLTDYLVELGIPRNKISTGFHYVDGAYYKGSAVSTNTPRKIITMGALQRDYSMIANIVKQTPEVEWVICRGRKATVDEYFPKSPNVHLLGYMEEDELRKQMSLADASLNVMLDTVGSNVITTSLSMGLVMLVSDVGSIRDYCDEKNAYFCSNTVSSFVTAIHRFAETKDDVVKNMKNDSIDKSKMISIEKVNEWFSLVEKSV